MKAGVAEQIDQTFVCSIRIVNKKLNTVSPCTVLHTEADIYICLICQNVFHQYSPWCAPVCTGYGLYPRSPRASLKPFCYR